jgi:hypothetical protein
MAGVGIAMITHLGQARQEPHTSNKPLEQSILVKGESSEAELAKKRNLYTQVDWQQLASMDPNAAFLKLQKAGYFPGHFAAIRTVFEALALQDIEDAKKKVSAIPGVWAQRQGWEAIFDQIYEESPAEALDLAVDMRLKFPGQYREILTKLAISSPKKAASYLKLARAGRKLEDDVAIAMQAIADGGELREAFEWHDSHFGGSVSPRVIRNLLMARTSEQPRAVSELSNELPDGIAKTDLLRNVALSWSRNDPEATIAWISTIEDPMVRLSLTQSALRQISDPTLAASLTATLPSKESYETAIKSITANKIQSSNYESLVDWIDQLPNAKTREIATSQFVHSWARLDPQATGAYILKNESSAATKVERLSYVAKIIAAKSGKSARIWLTTLPADLRDPVQEKFENSLIP